MFSIGLGFFALLFLYSFLFGPGETSRRLDGGAPLLIGIGAD